jgi:hypothetical protein
MKTFRNAMTKQILVEITLQDMVFIWTLWEKNDDYIESQLFVADLHNDFYDGSMSEINESHDKWHTELWGWMFSVSSCWYK